MKATAFPASKNILYAFGMMGWSIMINIISVILIYVYAPPDKSGLPLFISQAVIFGAFNIISFITVSGRLADAFWDPLIAQLSDKSTHKKGRRIPFMKRAILPSFLFCCLIFFPLHAAPSAGNVAWLIFTLALFYISSTTFIIPYNALLPELAPASKEKVRLATWQSLGFVVGAAVSSNTLNIADLFLEHGYAQSKIEAIQYTVIVLTALGAACMAITSFFIDETKYTQGNHSKVVLRAALKQTLTNKNFMLFVVADIAYMIGLTIIIAGLLYFVTVLLQLDERIGNKLMITMIGVSFLFYPFINFLSGRVGKKPIVIFSFILLAIVFAGIYFLGKTNIVSPTAQIYLLVIFAAMPMASLSILPVAILSEIIAKDTRDTGSNKEAVYFAVRYFFVKLAQTLGVALFAMLLIYGKNVGHDLGVRLNGAVGFALCVIAAIVFTQFKDVGEEPINNLTEISE